MPASQSIRNRPEINQRVSKAAHIKELSTEIERLKADLFATREKNGIYMNPDECARPLWAPIGLTQELAAYVGAGEGEGEQHTSHQQDSSLTGTMHSPAHRPARSEPTVTT